MVLEIENLYLSLYMYDKMKLFLSIGCFETNLAMWGLCWLAIGWRELWYQENNFDSYLNFFERNTINN